MKELIGIRANEVGTHKENGEILELIFLASEAKYSVSNDETLTRNREVTDFRILISRQGMKALGELLINSANSPVEDK